MAAVGLKIGEEVLSEKMLFGVGMEVGTEEKLAGKLKYQNSFLVTVLRAAPVIQLERKCF